MTDLCYKIAILMLCLACASCAVDDETTQTTAVVDKHVGDPPPVSWSANTSCYQNCRDFATMSCPGYEVDDCQRDCYWTAWDVQPACKDEALAYQSCLHTSGWWCDGAEVTVPNCYDEYDVLVACDSQPQPMELDEQYAWQLCWQKTHLARRLDGAYGECPVHEALVTCTDNVLRSANEAPRACDGDWNRYMAARSTCRWVCGTDGRPQPSYPAECAWSNVPQLWQTYRDCVWAHR